MVTRRLGFYLNMTFSILMALFCGLCAYSSISKEKIGSWEYAYIAYMVFLGLHFSRDVVKEVFKKIKLKREHCKVCDRCFGTGWIFIPTGSKSPISRKPILRYIKTKDKDFSRCEKCKGNGKLDWVQQMKGEV